MMTYKGRGNWMHATVELILSWHADGDLQLPVHAGFHEVKEWFFGRVGLGDMESPHRVKLFYIKLDCGEIPIEAFHGPYGLAVFKAWMIKNGITEEV